MPGQFLSLEQPFDLINLDIVFNISEVEEV